MQDFLLEIEIKFLSLLPDRYSSQGNGEIVNNSGIFQGIWYLCHH